MKSDDQLACLVDKLDPYWVPKYGDLVPDKMQINK